MKRIFFVKPNLSIPDKITIVGSSKSILKKRSGKEIDNSKFIVRFNFPETKGFEKYTGTQTSLMVINNINYSRLKFDKILQKPCKFLVISPNKEKKYISNLDIFFFEKKIYQYLLALRLIKHPVIFLNLIKILSSKNFSVGFCFILLCISSGIKINIYGSQVSGWTTVVVLVSFLSGLNLIILSMLSEYIIRVNRNLSSKNKYFIRQLIKK